MLFSRTPSITPAEAADRARAGGLVIVDVREPTELRAGRIAGARHIPLGDLGRRLDELQHGRAVAFLCRSGARSARATRVARKAGLDAVNVSGGMMGWSRAGLPVSR